MAESLAHKTLKQVALRWVQRTGCVAFACEIGWAMIGIADVAGIKANGDVYIVEAKISNSDMRSDMKNTRRNVSKIYRITNSRSVDFVYYIVADDVKIPDMFPAFIGLLDSTGRIKRNAKRRQRAHKDQAMLNDFGRFARKCSWRAYGHVLRHEQEQLEFSI